MEQHLQSQNFEQAPQSERSIFFALTAPSVPGEPKSSFMNSFESFDRFVAFAKVGIQSSAGGAGATVRGQPYLCELASLQTGLITFGFEASLVCVMLCFSKLAQATCAGGYNKRFRV